MVAIKLQVVILATDLDVQKTATGRKANKFKGWMPFYLPSQVLMPHTTYYKYPLFFIFKRRLNKLLRMKEALVLGFRNLAARRGFRFGRLFFDCMGDFQEGFNIGHESVDYDFVTAL